MPVGIKENQKSFDLSIYPNPANDIINFKLEILNGVASVQIYNATGQLIKEEENIFKDKSTSIKTDGLPNGVYLLKVSGLDRNNNTIIASTRIVIAR